MIKDAHEELEHVRVVFMQLRERNNIEYYIDHLTRFHEPMETIVLTVKGKNEESLALKDIIAIRKTLPEARQLWHITSSAKFDASLYEFDKNKTAQLHALVKKQQQSLKQLEKAIKKGSMTEIIQAGLAIKPGFAKLFKAFGHFPASQ